MFIFGWAEVDKFLFNSRCPQGTGFTVFLASDEANVKHTNLALKDHLPLQPMLHVS